NGWKTVVSLTNELGEKSAESILAFAKIWLAGQRARGLPPSVDLLPAPLPACLRLVSPSLLRGDQGASTCLYVFLSLAVTPSWRQFTVSSTVGRRLGRWAADRADSGRGVRGNGLTTRCRRGLRLLRAAPRDLVHVLASRLQRCLFGLALKTRHLFLDHLRPRYSEGSQYRADDLQEQGW